MIHPAVFLIQRQSKVNDVINENRTECKYGQYYYKMMIFFSFFDQLWVKEIHTHYYLCIIMRYHYFFINMMSKSSSGHCVSRMWTISFLNIVDLLNPWYTIATWKFWAQDIITCDLCDQPTQQSCNSCRLNLCEICVTKQLSATCTIPFSD